MEILTQLQDWYQAQCNGDWEHQYGVSIDTLDNPGWSVKVDVIGTDLENKAFSKMAYGIGPDSEPQSDDWMSCQVEHGKFFGVGGPRKLEEIIEVFLGWAIKTND